MLFSSARLLPAQADLSIFEDSARSGVVPVRDSYWLSSGDAAMSLSPEIFDL